MTLLALGLLALGLLALGFLAPGFLTGSIQLPPLPSRPCLPDSPSLPDAGCAGACAAALTRPDMPTGRSGKLRRRRHRIVAARHTLTATGLRGLTAVPAS